MIKDFLKIPICWFNDRGLRWGIPPTAWFPVGRTFEGGHLRKPRHEGAGAGQPGSSFQG